MQDLSSLTRKQGMEPMPPAVEAQSPNHWTTREFPGCCFQLLRLWQLVTQCRKPMQMETELGSPLEFGLPLPTAHPKNPRTHDRGDLTPLLKLSAILSLSRPFCISRQINCPKTQLWDFPGGAVVKNLPVNAGDTGSSPGLGRSHKPRSN